MTHPVVPNPLSQRETVIARDVRMFLLCKGVVAQHHIDGEELIPRGRWILILGRRRPQQEEEYLATMLAVAAPDKSDPTRKLAGVSVLKASPRKPFRFLVVPVGREREFFHVALKAAGLPIP